MYIVTCPACSTENHGYAIECQKCHHSLEGLKRIRSAETTQPEPRFWTHVHDLFVDGDDPIPQVLPQSNCFDCFSDKPTKTFIDYQGIPVASSHQSLGSAGGSGVKTTTTSRELTLSIPLCANCHYARNSFINADPKFFDPDYRERPSITRASKIWEQVFVLSVIATILLLIFKANIGVYFLYATVTLLIVGLILNRLSSSHDRNLMKGLKKEVESRYTWFIRGSKAENTNKKFFGSPRYRWHWQLQFHNELYWELFKKDNQIN